MESYTDVNKIFKFNISKKIKYHTNIISSKKIQLQNYEIET